MPFLEAKVYYDGSHYICIPYREPRKKKKKDEDLEEEENKQEEPAKEKPMVAMREATDEEIRLIKPREIDLSYILGEEPVAENRLEVFEKVYKDSWEMNRQARYEMIYDTIRPLSASDDDCKLFVEANLERKKKSGIQKKTRIVRKVNLQHFNYFVTFTYDDNLHTEDSFRKKLKRMLSNFASRRGWKYIGVFERSPEKQRLHFHGLFYIPPGTLPCEPVQVKEYSVRLKRVQTTYEMPYFAKRFGRADFEQLEETDIYSSLSYILKYIEKTGEKIMYSKGLPQYFISDIVDEDIICPYDESEKKYVLSDTFTCYDYGEVMGTVSREVIDKMRKCN